MLEHISKMMTHWQVNKQARLILIGRTYCLFGVFLYSLILKVVLKFARQWLNILLELKSHKETSDILMYYRV